MKQFRITDLENNWLGLEPVSQKDLNKYRILQITEAFKLGLPKDVLFRVEDILLCEIDEDGLVTQIKSYGKSIYGDDEIHLGISHESGGDFWDETDTNY